MKTWSPENTSGGSGCFNQGAREEKPRVFFDLAKSDLDDEQKEQVLKPLVQAHASDKLVLNGFASEEGSAESNRDLITRRLQEVNRALRALSHQGKRELVSKLEDSSGQIDYRYWRAVEVVVGAPGPKSANKTDECSRLYPSFDSEYPKRIQQAIADVTNARALLSAADDNVKSLFSRVFFTSDPGEIGIVSENLGKLQEQLSLFSDIESNRIRCGTRNDPLCNRAAGAYVTGRGMGGDSTLTLCPPDPYDIQVIIHESAHAAKDFGTADHAYRHESLIFHLTTEQAMTNTDSYVVLIELLNAADPSKVEFGSPNPVRSLPGVTREERAQLEKAVAWVQGGITTMYAQSAALYGVLHDSITAGAWTNPEYQRLMAAFAQLFGLTKPPSLPKESDKWSVAAIYDRLQKMSGTTSAPLTGSKTSGDSADPANIPFWSEGPGFSFTVNPDFFNKDLDEQVRSLLSLLVKATPGIGSERVPSYVEAVAASRKFLGLAWPWVPA